MNNGYHDPSLVQRVMSAIGAETPLGGLRLMEVCGTHTAAFSASGLRGKLSDQIRLVSGPGCPVCVTPISFLDAAVELAEQGGLTLLTFGDMAAVRGSSHSLWEAKALGARVRVVTTPTAALALAAREPGEEFVFLACGFETTAPAVAAMVLDTQAVGAANLSILCALRKIGPAIRAVLESGTALDGLICPGHVAAVTGAAAFSFVPEEFSVPAVVAGFEPLDLALAVWHLARLCKQDRAELVNAYRRVVKSGGNKTAKSLTARVFRTADAGWRGLGKITDSGLTLRPELHRLDAVEKYGLSLEEKEKDNVCHCSDVLRGAILPDECPGFGRSCTPLQPLGPCMVSREGSCSVYWRYERRETVV